MKLATIVLFLLAGSLSMTAVAADLVVIDLHHRTAEDILPALRPMVGRDVSLSGMDYKLLVRGNASDVAKLREMLAVLDREPKQLLISVRYTGVPQSNANEFGAHANVIRRETQIGIRGSSTVSTSTDSNVSSVRVLEGNSARIASGQSVPIVTAFIPTYRGGRSTGIGIATDYRDLSSGFTVLPRINGDRVTLDISAGQERLTDSNSGSVASQHVTTTLAGRLGEWIDLGGVTSSVDERQSGVGVTGGGRRINTQSDQRSISIKVDYAQ